MVEPLACCLHGIDRAEVGPGQTVAILGLGPIGLMLCAAARDAGANVVAVGGRPERRALAPQFGASPGEGKGADVVIEAVGSEEAWRHALELVRPGGTVLFFGGREASVDIFRLHYEELTPRGAFHHTPAKVRAALAFLASGAHPWHRLITHEVGLDGVATLLADPPPDYLKAAVYP
jgi:L-iditol 2-dehydrogenase